MFNTRTYKGFTKTSHTVELIKGIKQNDSHKVQTAAANGADVEQYSESGETPLLYCLRFPKNLASLDGLLKAGANVHNLDRDNTTNPVLVALSHKNTAPIWLMSKHKVDFNTTFKDKYYMQYAFQSPRSNDFVEKLLEAGTAPVVENYYNVAEFYATKQNWVGLQNVYENYMKLNIQQDGTFLQKALDETNVTTNTEQQHARQWVKDMLTASKLSVENK